MMRNIKVTINVLKKTHDYIILKINIQKVKNAFNACNQNKDNV